jgi:hypothetical protein
MDIKDKCSQCGDPGSNLYGYIICDSCKSKLGLFTDDTIKTHVALYKNSSKKRSYEEEINYRLDFLEKDLIKKRIKLLHIKERLKYI